MVTDPYRLKVPSLYTLLKNKMYKPDGSEDEFIILPNFEMYTLCQLY